MEGILHLLIIIANIIYFGLFYGIIGIYIEWAVISVLFSKFGYEIMPSFDYGFILNEKYSTSNVVGMFEMSKLNFKEIEETFKKGIGKFSGLGSVLVGGFGLFLLKDVGEEKALQQIKRISKRFNSKEEAFKYGESIYHDKFFDFQWELHVVENYKENESFLFLKFHHSLSDGMGMLGMFSLLNSKATHKSVL